jgi:hypothetical protein
MELDGCNEGGGRGDSRWGFAPNPGIFARLGSGARSAKEKPLTAFVVRGLVLDRRTLNLAIPWQVASPQSLTPFHQMGTRVTRKMKTRRSNSDKVVVVSSSQSKSQEEADKKQGELEFK